MNVFRHHPSVVQTQSATTPLETTAVHARVDIMSQTRISESVMPILVQVRVFYRAV